MRNKKIRVTNMQNENRKINLYKGMTLLERVIALVIIVIICEAILLQLNAMS